MGQVDAHWPHLARRGLELLRCSVPRVGQALQVQTGWFLVRGFFGNVFFPSSPFQFFAPLKPTRVMVEYNSHGDATGEADVHFESHDDAVAAMAKEGTQLRE